MRFLLLAILMSISRVAVIGQSGDYEIIQVDGRAGTFTCEANKQLRTFRVRPGVEVHINGQKSTFAALEVGMKVNVTAAEPGVATRIAASGLQSRSGTGTAGALLPAGSEPAEEQTAKISAKSADAFLLENLRKGTKLSLQFQKGSWKSWGNLATESPDSVKTERGDTCRLAIALPSKQGKPGKVLAVVPPETAKRPFIYEVPVDFPVLVLRINDPDGSFEKNPGGVEYRVKVFPPGK